MAKVKGIGGFFFKSNDRERLSNWYRDTLGFNINDFCGSTFQPDQSIPYVVWGLFKADTEYFEPSTKEFMLNLVVDDVEAVLKQAAKGGATIVGDIQKESYGEFGWFLDPEGNKIELWKPA